MREIDNQIKKLSALQERCTAQHAPRGRASDNCMEDHVSIPAEDVLNASLFLFHGQLSLRLTLLTIYQTCGRAQSPG